MILGGLTTSEFCEMQKFALAKLPDDLLTTPKADQSRQAVNALRGYAYQIWVTALAWIRIQPSQRIYLEVAEDYAEVVNQSLKATQVKQSSSSERVTLNHPDVKKAIVSFIDLQRENPDYDVSLRFYTTMDIGLEKDKSRPYGTEKGLEYWDKAGVSENVAPIREYLESDRFPDRVRKFSQDLSNTELRDRLLNRISWDCGQHSFSEIYSELIRSIEDIGRDQFDFFPGKAPLIADLLSSCILRRSVKIDPASRVLTCSDLRKIIISATHVTIPESSLNRLLNQLPDSVDSLSSKSASDSFSSIAQNKWLYTGSDLPKKKGMIKRVEVEHKLENAINEAGLAILMGSIGLGKSVISRSFARSHADEFYIVEFGDTSSAGIRHTLERILEKIACLRKGILILENFNAIENRDLRLLIEYVIAEIRKSNIRVLITCHVQPSPTTLTDLGIDTQDVVECQYFSLDEIKSLIKEYSGDSEEWSNLIFARSGSGHPALAHAIVILLANKNWPKNEKTRIFSSDFLAPDLERSNTSIRKRIVSELPKEERELLYRLSLVIGPFNRRLAIALSKIEPVITGAGESIDHLTGPWIEELPQSQYRISSLITQCGKEILSTEDLRRIHGCIVDELTSNAELSVGDMDRIFLHAISADRAEKLIFIARSVLLSESEIVRSMAGQSSLVMWRTDKPIYEKNALASAFMRLAQFKLAEVTGDKDRISKVVNALYDEIEIIPERRIRKALWAYSSVIITQSPGIVNYIDNWLSILLHTIAISRTFPFWKEDFDGVETAAISPEWEGFSEMFRIGVVNVNSIARLEFIVDQLCESPPESRSLLLQPLDESFSDYFELVRGAWLRERKSSDYDAEDALVRYGRIAEKTSEWNERCISLQAYAVQAAILEHDLDDPSRGVNLIQNVIKNCGHDPILIRAVGQMYLKKCDYENALTIYRRLVKEPGTSNPLQMAHTFREAAISAAHGNDMAQAEDWFMTAAHVVKKGDTNDLHALSLGLKADAAVIGLRSRQNSRALTRLRETVDGLAFLDPESSLRTHYTYATVCHTILHIRSNVNNEFDIQLDDLRYGLCSVPEPPEAILEHPLGPIEYAWYLLAETECILRENVGIRQSLRQNIPTGCIGPLEVSLQTTAIKCRLEDLDANGVADYLESYIDVFVFAKENLGELEDDVSNTLPITERVPKVPRDQYASIHVENAIKDVIVAFLIQSVLAGKFDVIQELKNILIGQFGEDLPCLYLLEIATGVLSRKSNFLECVIAEQSYLHSNWKVVVPKAIWITGMHFLKWVVVSSFRDSLPRELGRWLHLHWTQIISERRVHLDRPSQTVPPIEQILDDADSGIEFVARLLLVASGAVGIVLNSEDRQFLESLFSH